MPVKGLNLSEELWALLDRAALSEGRSRSNMVAWLVEKFLPHDSGPHGTWGVSGQVVASAALGEGVQALSGASAPEGRAPNIPLAVSTAPSPSAGPNRCSGCLKPVKAGFVCPWCKTQN